MTLAELKLLIDVNIPDNTTGLITPSKERQVMKALADFVVSSQGEADSTPFVYDPAFSYAINAPVIYDAAWYLSLAGANLNNQPDISPLSWEPVNAFNTVLSIWELNAVYLGELTIVIKDSKLYLLDRDTVGADPYVSTDFAAELAAGDWINLLPNNAPLANTYADSAAMIAAQGSQVAGYFYFGGSTLYVYLGTTDGDIDDYYELGSGGGGGITGVGTGTGIAVDNTNPLIPVVALSTGALSDIAKGVTAEGWGDHAAAGYLTSQVYPEMQVREDNQLLFDNDYSTGIEAAARTGNITVSFTGAKRGAVTVMRHNDGSAFTYPTENIIVSGEYVASVDNYLCFILVNKTATSEVILCTISQEI